MNAAGRKGRAKSEPRCGKRSQRSIPVTQWLSMGLSRAATRLRCCDPHLSVSGGEQRAVAAPVFMPVFACGWGRK